MFSTRNGMPRTLFICLMVDRELGEFVYPFSLESLREFDYLIFPEVFERICLPRPSYVICFVYAPLSLGLTTQVSGNFWNL